MVKGVHYGYKQGCNFVNKDCAELQAAHSDHFCAVGDDTLHCNKAHTKVVTCSAADTMNVRLADGCLLKETVISNRDCSLPRKDDEGGNDKFFGQFYHQTESRCLMGNVSRQVELSYIPDQTPDGGCYKVECKGSSEQKAYDVSVTDETATHTLIGTCGADWSGKKLAAPAATENAETTWRGGYVECEDPSIVCWNYEPPAPTFTFSYVVGSYSSCAGVCSASRSYSCQRNDGAAATVSDCTGNKPADDSQSCKCAFSATDWGECSGCGGGATASKKTRGVMCANDAGAVGSQVCIDAGVTHSHALEETCEACAQLTYSFVAGDYGKCEKTCRKTRAAAICVRSDGQAADNSDCDAAGVQAPLADTASCGCAFTASDWGDCSADCDGKKTRTVACANEEGGAVDLQVCADAEVTHDFELEGTCGEPCPEPAPAPEPTPPPVEETESPTPPPLSQPETATPAPAPTPQPVEAESPAAEPSPKPDATPAPVDSTDPTTDGSGDDDISAEVEAPRHVSLSMTLSLPQAFKDAIGDHLATRDYLIAVLTESIKDSLAVAGMENVQIVDVKYEWVSVRRLLLTDGAAGNNSQLVVTYTVAQPDDAAGIDNLEEFAKGTDDMKEYYATAFQVEASAQLAVHTEAIQHITTEHISNLQVSVEEVARMLYSGHPKCVHILPRSHFHFVNSN